MSNAIIDINVLDYAGSPTLSSYSLTDTPLLFYPEYTIFNDTNNRAVWDFGDGTISREVSASKVYSFPGEYIVSMVLFDCKNNSVISTIQKTIKIYDFVELTFNIINPIPLEFMAGSISDTMEIHAFYPHYQQPLDLYYYISGSNSKNYWNELTNKHVHLDNTHVFYDKFFNNVLGDYQYREIDRITPITTKLYAKKLSGGVVFCDESDSGSFFVGMSGKKDVFFRDDSLTDSLYITLKFDKTKYKIPNIDEELNYLNNLGITLSAMVVDTDPLYLSVTSNGLDGEGIVINSFNINTVKYYEAEIPFVVKLKSFDHFNLKTFDSLELSTLNITLSATQPKILSSEDGNDILSESGEQIITTSFDLLPHSTYNISSLNYTLSDQDHGGSFRGVIKFLTQDYPLQDAIISVNTTISKGLSTYNLSGTSNYFNVYPIGYFDMYKKNENFIANETIKDLIFQEILIDKNVLFDDFIGGVLGDSNYNHETIGTKIYEKISNFVTNTQSLDTCEIEFLDSLCQYLGYNDVNEEKYNYPEKIKRLVSLLSINKHNLFGVSNKFDENFNPRGDTSKQVYGKNLGTKIDDIINYTVTAGNHIVALEKFSNNYTLLNTFQPVSATGSHTYPLSDYSVDWGWPMVLPTNFNFEDMDKYYLFFEHIPTYESSILDGVVDFDNEKTTIPFPISNNIYEHMFLDTLYDSLSLIY